jgi:hypothetical protein
MNGDFDPETQVLPRRAELAGGIIAPGVKHVSDDTPGFNRGPVPLLPGAEMLMERPGGGGGGT